MFMYVGYLMFLSLVLLFFCSLCSVGKEADEEMYEELRKEFKNKNN